ncbi:MAG: amino acid adenylation domain-containing protein [Bacteroidia bacterium]|nr:amino acid adenylation domain-containing protein [Bacteroidia bacterium]
MSGKTSPITYAQQGVYIDCILDPESFRYNNPYAVSFPLSVSPDALAEAARKVLEKHPALFSHFEDRDGCAVQVYAEKCCADVKVTRVDDGLVESVKKSFPRYFDINKGPLYRAEVIAAPSETALLVDFQHLVYDGSSLNILIKEICAVLEGAEPSEEPNSYIDFAEAQKADKTDHKAFYDKLFEGGVTSTALPADLNGEGGAHSEHVRFVSAPDVMSRAKAMSTAPSALFIAAAFYTLSRYTNTRDLSMTTISNGRLNPMTKGVVGMFVNTLPLVCRIEDVTVREFILGIRKMFQDVRSHEEYPFSSLVNDYGLENNVRFTYQYGTFGNAFQVNGEDVRESRLLVRTLSTPVTITINCIDDRPAIVINYETARFSEEMMSRFAESMDAVVSRFIDDPDGRLLSTSIMSGSQKAEVAALRQTCIDPSAVRFPLFHNCIEYWAEKTPDATAVIACNETLTYREFNGKANVIAHALIEKGVAPGDRVCLLLPRRSWHLLAMFGVMKAGAAYIPCDPEYPAERIKLITEDSHARFVITTKDKMAEYGDRALDVEELLDGTGVQNPAVKQDGDSLAYLIYTSGSTGRPKGVMLRHTGICNYLTDHEENRHFHALVSDCSTMLCITTVSFDLSLKEIGASLFNGMTLVFADEDQVNDPQALADLMLATGVDGFSGTPSRLKMFLDLPDFQKAFAKCKFIVLGGEKYPPTLLPQVKELAPAARLFNTYGPTEISVSSNGKELTHADRITIGRPLLNVREYVVDEDLNELPVGVTGELLIGGLGVAAGYNDLPDKTAEAFIEYDGERCYKSGDYAYWNAEGEVIILGRKDHQIKLNGLRIELGEVETVLCRQPQVKEGVVMIKNVDGHDHLVAYYTAREDVDENVLKEQMGRSLTHYMVPTIFVKMDRMPVSPNGKTDLKALPEPVLELSQEEKVMPATADEQSLYDIVAGIVGNTNFGTTTNLLSAGLTSLLAIRLSVVVKDKMDAALPVRDVLRYPTVRELAARLQHDVKGNAEDKDVQSAPLSFSQLGIYSECMGAPEDIRYNIPECVDMPKGVTSPELKTALERVLAAHPYMNTHFQTDENGNAYQCPMAKAEADIPVLTMSDAELEQHKDVFVRPFDLQEGPLYRIEIVETPSGVHLMVDFHHLIMDGGSIDIFYRQLCLALDGSAIEKEDYNYYQFAASQKIEEPAERFFEGQLSRLEEASALIPDKYDNDDSHDLAEVRVPADLQAVQEKCSKLNITPASLYLAAVAVAVSKYISEDTVGICTVSNGRSNLRVSGTFGMFVNTLPLVSDVDCSLSVDDYLKKVSETFMDTLANEDYPYGKIVEKLGYAASIMYAYQVGVLNSYRCAKGGLTLHKLELQKAKFPVSVMIEGNNEQGGTIHVEYDGSLFSSDMMEGFASAVRNVVTQMLTCVQMKELSLCDAGMTALLDSFNVKENPVSAEEDASETVLSLFRRAAKQYPDNIAGVFNDKKYTYRELDELTDRIGSLIYGKVKDCGKSEPVVSILIPRNEYIFILPLAAMKAGCAYQPLDPSYPQDRLNFMVKDADAALLIADPELLALVTEYDGEVLTTDSLDHEGGMELPAEPLGPQSLFILLYTSGSTGEPKGVMLEHQNLVAFIKWYRRYYGLKPEHKVAAYASFGFDANMMDLYPALTSGATVFVVAEELRLDLVALNDYFEANGITHSFMTTQVGVQFLQNTDNRSLKHLSVGGEKLVSVDPSDRYIFHNGYGPTECTVFSTTTPVLKKEPNIPIGKPTDLLDCYVMDKQLHRLPVGAAGELIIVGRQVGRGYLNRPEKTAEAFFTLNGERAYHSGDIVRYRQDGSIEFVGRKDGQVKIRGFRIELKEVEAVIRDFEGIKDVTVQAFDNPDGGKFIAAYVVGDAAVDTDALNAFILDRKPPYMVPAVTVQIDRIPLNVNQKVDRKALPKPELRSTADKGSASAAPLNALEKELKSIIASVVNTDDFAITDVLGYVGLTSISGIRLATLIYKRFGVKVNAGTLSKSGSLQSIENEILESWMNGGSNAAAGLAGEPVPENRADILEAPLTFPQQGVYMDCQMNPDTTMYNIPTMLEFPAETSPEALAAAVKKTIELHPALFCNFFQTDDGVVMRKTGANGLTVDVKTMSAAELEQYRKDFVRPFNLERDVLVRAEIVSVPGESNFLLIDLHHLVADGGSLNIIVRQIVDLLNGNGLEEETCSYLRFAAEQNARAGKSLAESKAFYDEMFSMYESAANVPADKTSTEAGMPQHVRTAIPEYLFNLKLPAGVTQAHFWFAAFNYALSRFANTKDVYTAFISGGRQNIDIADTVGMFVNTLPCAVHIKEQTVSEYISEVSETFFGCIEHENYPFSRIAADYDFKGCASYAYQMGVKSAFSVGGKDVIQSSMAPLSKAKVPFSIFIQNCNGIPCVDAEYDDAQYSDGLALHFTESVVAVAEHFAADMDAKVKHTSIMSERQRLEVEGMHSVSEDMSFPIRTFHEGIEQWAEKTPDAIALMACDRDMTYREYNAEANRLARALIARGMEKGDRVVLLLPRRSYYLTSLFAVMKCGGAFIPMDPEYPADRIEYILNDSEGRFVITTEDRVANYPGRAIDIKVLMEEAAGLPDGNLDVKVDPHDLAYLIYTSGSTGRPKGVMIEHLGAASFLTFYKHDTNFGSDSNANHIGLCQSTVSFDLSVGEIGVQMFNGETIVFANEDEIMSPVEMVKLCRRTGAQTISGTPSRLAVNLELKDYYDLVKDQMRCVVTGGEKLPGALLDELEKMNVYIINTYGPTETTMGSSAGVLNGTREIHVGKPFTNYTYQVLDGDRNELPVGVMGELCIGGIGLARGYNNMPERTAETFIEWQGKRIYRTGDYAMWTKDGNIIIMGRTDNQVKLNGLRIELGEIESVMAQQPGMRQCVAVIKKLGSIDKLIGYYTIDETVADMPAQAFEEILRMNMSLRLTPYMVPGIFVRLDEMPLTPVGKTDIKRLPMPELRSSAYTAPENDTEKTFCDIFGKILKVEKVGAEDNFFEMGGTSLVAMQLIAEAAKAGYSMVYKNVFDNATPRLLAQMLKPELYEGKAKKSELPLIDEIESYDYSQLDELLAANNIGTFRNGECYGRMGDVLLTGATGFLGIHVLHNLIGRDDVPHIYCLVRGGKSISAESRVRTLLYYYFGEKYEDQFGSRIVVINGDVTNADSFNSFDKHIDILINCAANVKHFSAGTDIEDINIKGCQNCIDLCLRTGARFIQTSTGSVAGQSVSDKPVSPYIFTERDLYRGQELPSKYSASKFLAERAVLDAVKNRGLKGKVMRLGNLSARSTDGEFQINFRSNNAMSALKAYQTLGCIPYEKDCGYSEFSPINEVADAIVRLSLTPDGCTVFQPGNVHWPPYGDIIDCMNRIGISIERVETEEFQRRLSEAMQDPVKSELVQSLVAYKEASDGRFRVGNGWDTKAYTAQVLLRLGFRWSFTTWDYIEKYLRCLQGLGVFDNDFKR